MKKQVLLILLSLGLLQPLGALGQEESQSKFSVDLGVMLKNRHVWNGGLSYNAWNLQPDLTLSYNGFYFEAWGVYTVAAPYGCETDLYLGYDNEYINFWYGDFFYANETEKFNHFFRYDAAKYGGDIHQQMAQLKFKGVEKFPLGISCGVFTFGDRESTLLTDADGNPVNESGQMVTEETDYVYNIGPERYSMYIELSYEHTLKTGQTLGYAVLGTPYKGFFADGANICSIKFSVSQPIKVTDSFQMRMTGDLIFNPYREDLFFVLGVGF